MRAGAGKSQIPHAHRPIWELFAVSHLLWLCAYLNQKKKPEGVFFPWHHREQGGSVLWPSYRQPETANAICLVTTNTHKIMTVWKENEERQKSHDLLEHVWKILHTRPYYPLGEHMHWPTAAADASLLAKEHTHTHTTRIAVKQGSHGLQAKSFLKQEQLYNHPVFLAGLQTLPLLLKKLAEYLQFSLVECHVGPKSRQPGPVMGTPLLAEAGEL